MWEHRAEFPKFCVPSALCSLSPGKNHALPNSKAFENMDRQYRQFSLLDDTQHVEQMPLSLLK